MFFQLDVDLQAKMICINHRFHLGNLKHLDNLLKHPTKHKLTCFLLDGTFIPQLNDFLLTDKSFNPDLTKLITSFFLVSGSIKSGFLL